MTNIAHNFTFSDSTQNGHWVARIGVLRRGGLFRSYHEQIRRVDRIVIHEHYVDKGFVNDIALLRLESPLQFRLVLASRFIGSVINHVNSLLDQSVNTFGQSVFPRRVTTLAAGTVSCAPPLAGASCTSMDEYSVCDAFFVPLVRKLTFEQTFSADTLQEVKLPIMSTDECRKRTLFLPLYKITENMFCAGYDRGGRDACLVSVTVAFRSTSRAHLFYLCAQATDMIAVRL